MHVLTHFVNQLIERKYGNRSILKYRDGVVRRIPWVELF